MILETIENRAPGPRAPPDQCSVYALTAQSYRKSIKCYNQTLTDSRNFIAYCGFQRRLHLGAHGALRSFNWTWKDTPPYPSTGIYCILPSQRLRRLVISHSLLCSRLVRPLCFQPGADRGTSHTTTRQPISCYYYALKQFDTFLIMPTSYLTNAQISFSRKPGPPQCSLASLARVPKVTPSKNPRSANASFHLPL